MKLAQNTIAIATVLALVFALAPHRARAYCTGATSWSGTTVRVRIHADMHNQMRHRDGTFWTRAELERSVAFVLNRINESARADAPYVWLDTATAPSTCTWLDTDCVNPPNEDLVASCGIADTIHLVPSNCGSLWWFAQGTTQVIRIQAQGASIGQARYGHADIPPDGTANWTWNFESRLLHELGHALGAGHPSGCASWSTVCPSGATACAVMNSHEPWPAMDYYTVDDTNGFNAIYGNRDAPVQAQYERTIPGTSYSAIATGTADATSFFAASSTSPMGVMAFVGYNRAIPTLPDVYTWNWSTFAQTHVGVANLYVSTGPIGVAQSASRTFIATQTPRFTNDSRRWSRRLTVTTIPTSGAYTTIRTDPAAGSTADTNVPGVSSARDPSSGATLHAYRTDGGYVVLQGILDSGDVSNPVSLSIRSKTQPVIACSQVFAYARNCTMVVGEIGEPFTTSTEGRLQFFDFSWAQSGTTASIATTGFATSSWTLFGDPQLSVAEALPGGAVFAVSMQVPYATSSTVFGTQVYLLSRPQGGSTWSLSNVFSTPSRSPHIAMGGVSASFEALTFTGTRSP